MSNFSIDKALAQQESCRANRKVIKKDQEVCSRQCKRCARYWSFKSGKRGK